jgi:hypothetical protein
MGKFICNFYYQLGYDSFLILKGSCDENTYSYGQCKAGRKKEAERIVTKNMGE